MKTNVVKVTCDLCLKETEKYTEVNYPVLFFTEQNEGRTTAPYISQQKMDLCPSCLDKAVIIHGRGAQGWNKYTTK